MHFDLAHALVTAALLYATIIIMRKLGWATTERRFDWNLVAGMALAVFILNLVWPWP